MAIGRTLTFSRDGGHAAIVAGEQLHFAQTAGGGAPVTVPVGPVIDLAAVGAEFWVVAGNTPGLRRFSASGHELGLARRVTGDGALVPAALGPAGAAWTAVPCALFAAEGAAVVVPGEPDWVVPVTHNRWVVCGRGRFQLRDLTSERWTIPAGGGRVVGGAAVFEGRSVALVVATSGGSLSQLVVLGLHDGATHHRIALTGVGRVRFAATRGLALMQAGARTVILLDLRFGRVLKEVVLERDLVDLAIDDAGQAVMLRHGDSLEDVTVTTVRELVAASAPPTTTEVATSVDEPAPASAEVPAAAGAEAAAAATPAPSFHEGPPLGAVPVLAPRIERAALPLTAAAALLDRYRDLVAAMVGRAVLAAWNDGRLAFPNQGAFPYEAEVRALLGSGATRAQPDLTAAEARVHQTSGALRAAEVGQALSPLSLLCEEFGLATLGRLVLLLVAAPALWGELARLYAILANDEHRPLVDELMLQQILGPSVRAYDLARELDRDGPLVRYGLIQVGVAKMRPFLPLRVEPVVLRLLRGDDGHGDLEGVRVVSTVRAFEALLIPTRCKRAIVEQLALPATEGPGRLVIRGRDGSGRHALLATLAEAAGRQLGIIDATMILRDLKLRGGELAAALRRAHLLGLLPCVDGLETLPSEDQAARDTVREILDAHPGPLAIRLPWDGQPPIAPGYVAIDLPTLTIDERIACWQTVLAEHALHVAEPEELAVRYAVGPGVIYNVCGQVATRHAPRPDAPPTAEGAPIDLTVELEEAVRQHLETKLRATATRVTRLASWAKVVLPPDIQESVLELIARIKHRRIVYDTWGFDRVLTTARGVTALFSGGPGTGKTLVASAIANELGMDLYRVDLSRVMSKWIGETEQNLAKLFDAAEDGHSIILFDEADSLFAKRTEVKSSVDRYANLEVNYLLQRLDTFEGIAILTTNFGTSIDSAFKRRLSFRLTFPFPDEEARESLWRSHLPPGVPRAGAFDFADLARRYRLSGGYIRNATVRAAFLAAEEHAPLSQDHLERAIRAEFREIGKIAESGVLE
jgi:hypothetical protein